MILFQSANTYRIFFRHFLSTFSFLSWPSISFHSGAESGKRRKHTQNFWKSPKVLEKSDCQQTPQKIRILQNCLIKLSGCWKIARNKFTYSEFWKTVRKILNVNKLIVKKYSDNPKTAKNHSEKISKYVKMFKEKKNPEFWKFLD